ncbi:MAG: M23 family metallopeptidase [Chloroflexi bacterium]|nr:M23 family metallopeptidase [Chloroflexota bacterium]
MGFPFLSTTDYEYANNFLDRRAGVARHYNHVRGVLGDGSLERAHDGIDLYVERGTPVRSVFEGIVINPARRWRPWDPARYGRTVVVISTEPTSRGYTALMVHLSRVDVRHGDRVRRGQVVGRTGDTGNAEGVPIHLHFELRAPFELRLREAGRIRHVDAFDPYPSLRAADPQRPHARR